MHPMMKPQGSKTKPQATPLEVITANMLCLYMKAKLFHLNASGEGFYGAHKTFDGIADLGVDWFDTLAERMRALQIPVCVCPSWANEHSLLEEETGYDSEIDEMFESMTSDLEVLSNYINAHIKSYDGTTGNMLQELDAELGKQAYFTRSSI